MRDGRARGSKISMSLHLNSYFMCASSELGSGETVHMKLHRWHTQYMWQESHELANLTLHIPRAIHSYPTDLDKQTFPVWNCKYFLTYNLGAQKKRLIETVLLSTHNICFGWEIRKLFFCYKLLTKVLLSISLNMCFECSKELSHWDSSLEYPQHMYWLRNKKKNSATHSYLETWYTRNTLMATLANSHDCTPRKFQGQ